MDEIISLSEGQKKALALLPIPTAILSVVGSSFIISMALRSRNEDRWTPYTRLLIGLSISDIISSLNAVAGNFLRPAELTDRAWAVGNTATCSFSGFWTQIGSSAILYNGMLSFYFLLIARFGIKNSRIARTYEPIMHSISIGFPLITATLGAIMGFFGAPEIGQGCWVDDFPKNCGEESGIKCWGTLIGTIYGGLPFTFAFLSIPINNLVIYIFVRRSTIGTSSLARNQSSKKSIKSGLQDVSYTGRNETQSHRFGESDSKSFDSSPDELSKSEVNIDDERSRNITATMSSRKVRKDQRERLRLVRSQAMLFVASFFICLSWTGFLLIAEAPTDDEEKLNKSAVLVLCNAFFYPLQGFLNMLIFIRPKYIRIRHDFPNETKLWAFKRALRGERVPLENNDLEVQGKRGSSIEEKKNAPNVVEKDEVQQSEDFHRILSERGKNRATIPTVEEYEKGAENSSPRTALSSTYRMKTNGRHVYVGRSSLEAISELTELSHPPS